MYSIMMMLPSCKVPSRSGYFRFDVTQCQRRNGAKRERVLSAKSVKSLDVKPVVPLTIVFQFKNRIYYRPGNISQLKVD